MTRDIERKNNRMKKQAWGIVPLVIAVVAVIAIFGQRLGTPPEPRVLDQSSAGMVLELPVVSDGERLDWQADWTPSSQNARQQVAQSLSQLYADYKQLRPQLLVVARPGSETRLKLARRIGDALANHHIGRLDPVPTSVLPAVSSSDAGVILFCDESDIELARRLLGALAPFLGGRVSVHYDSQTRLQSMRLYFYGTPWFNQLGQATFDEHVYAPEQT